MKITVCIRCQSWSVGERKLSEFSKQSIIRLNSENYLDVEFKNEVCNYCRQGIGDEVSDRMLKIFSDEKKQS